MSAEDEKEPTLEVFQDLTLPGNSQRLNDFRARAIELAKHPWQHATDREAEIARITIFDGDTIVFRREPSETVDSATVYLWRRGEAYTVSNIVPIAKQQLNYAEYNAVLADFITNIVVPAANEVDLPLETTPSRQSLEHWLSIDAARKLRAFSFSANKSTGSGHPSDEARWFEFIFAVHDWNEGFSTNLLMRWLVEIERWPEEVAHRLVIEYENALLLLKAYDRHRG